MSSRSPGKPRTALILCGALSADATAWIEESGRDIHIVYTGLRPGEKMHEVLIGANEHGERPKHPLVTHVRVKPLVPEEIEVVVVDDMAEMRSFMVKAANTL